MTEYFYYLQTSYTIRNCFRGPIEHKSVIADFDKPHLLGQYNCNNYMPWINERQSILGGVVIFETPEKAIAWFNRYKDYLRRANPNVPIEKVSVMKVSADEVLSLNIDNLDKYLKGEKVDD